MPALWWLVLGIALMVAELFNPGAFLLWLGLGALLTAVTVLAAPGLALVWQVVVFGLLSLGAILGYRQWRRRHPRIEASDHPLLNRRAAQFVGQVYTLAEPMVDGRGRLKIGDAYWALAGADLAAGTRVRVVATDGVVLQVQPEG